VRVVLIFRRRAGVLAQRGRPLYRATVTGRTSGSASHVAGLPVAGVVQQRRESNVRQQSGRVLGTVVVPPDRQRCVVVVVIAAPQYHRHRGRVHAVQSERRAIATPQSPAASPFVVRVAAPEPIVRRRRSARLETAGTEQGRARLSAVSHRKLPPVIRRTFPLYLLRSPPKIARFVRFLADIRRHHEPVPFQLHGRERADKPGRIGRGNGLRLEGLLERVYVRAAQRSQRQVRSLSLSFCVWVT